MEERFKTFTVLIAGISRSIRKIKTEEMAELELKSPHVSCLYYLYKSGPLTAKELGDICGEDKAAISRSIDYLEANGYLSCDSQAQKRYKARLTLTEKGSESAARIVEKIDRVLGMSGEGLTEAELKAMYYGLERVDANLRRICERYGE